MHYTGIEPNEICGWVVSNPDFLGRGNSMHLTEIEPMQNSPFPHIPNALLDELNQRYPERSPEPEWSDREVWIRAGERRVVRFLKEQFKRQNENILES